MSKAKAGLRRLNENFIAHGRSMRESPAWGALPDNARRVLDRLELEHMRHAGSANGALLCTYSDFEAAGIRRASVARAIREAVALGFLAIGREGYRTAAEFRAPSLYRLTYVVGAGKSPSPTDEWRAITTPTEALARLEAAEATPERKRTRTASPTESVDSRRAGAPRLVGAKTRLGGGSL